MKNYSSYWEIHKNKMAINRKQEVVKEIPYISTLGCGNPK